jgi:hypothetical protein
MSIPERLYRLARGKIGEIRELFDGSEDEEIDPELLAKIQRAQSRKTARQELEDAMDVDGTSRYQSPVSVPPARAATTLRTPDQIRGGQSASTPVNNNVNANSDPLALHYRLLGLEPGTDFATVQAVYEKLLSRCSPDRFTAGSPEAVEAKDIEAKLQATFKVLREALDPTARRFDMLEI